MRRLAVFVFTISIAASSFAFDVGRVANELALSHQLSDYHALNGQIEILKLERAHSHKKYLSIQRLAGSDVESKFHVEQAQFVVRHLDGQIEELKHQARMLRLVIELQKLIQETHGEISEEIQTEIGRKLKLIREANCQLIETKIKNAKVALAHHHSTKLRVSSLYDKKYISKAAFEQAGLDLARAQIQLSTLQTQLKVLKGSPSGS